MRWPLEGRNLAAERGFEMSSIVGSQDRAVCLVMNLMSMLRERSLSVVFSGGSASGWQRCDAKVHQLRLPGSDDDRDPAHLSASWLWTHEEVSVPMHFPLRSSSEPEMRSEDFLPERREKGFLKQAGSDRKWLVDL